MQKMKNMFLVILFEQKIKMLTPQTKHVGYSGKIILSYSWLCKHYLQ